MDTEIDQLRSQVSALRKVVASQERSIKEETVRLEASRSEMDAAHELLRVISDIQSRFISGSDTRELFDSLLGHLLRLTSSEYGFITEALFKVDGTPYLETRDLTDAT